VTDALVVIGGGEHGSVVIDAAGSAPGRWDVMGIVDPRSERAPATGLPDLGDDDAYLASLSAMPPDARPSLVLGIGGDVAARRRLVIRYEGAARWATVVHGAAVIAPSATIGPGAVVLAGAIVGPGARIGAHVTVNSGAIVEHDTTVGDHAHIAPGVVIGGGTTIGEGVVVGLGAVVRDHLTVGPDAVVAMGAVVVADVPAGATVAGIPARAMSD
jgi:acetyltransferase EpsM